MKLPLLVRQPVKIHIEQKYVHPLFSQKTKLAALHMLLDQILHGGQWQVPGVCHSCRLEHRCGGRDVGIET